jgi:hypothetical protein
MKSRLARALAVVFVSAGAIGIAAHAGEVRQFAAQYLNFDGSEQSTTLSTSSGGQPIYQGKIWAPADVDTLEVSISATGDLIDSGTPQSNSLWLSCSVDGQPCNGGVNSAAASAAGWVPVLSLQSAAQNPVPAASPTPGVVPDNNIHYTWCLPIKPNHGPHSLAHDVQLSMASGDGVHSVQIEQIHVLVGGMHFGGPNKANACTAAPVPTPVPQG